MASPAWTGDESWRPEAEPVSRAAAANDLYQTKEKSGQARQKQKIRQPATWKRSENPHQLRSGFLETVGGKKTVVYWIIDLMRVELKVCCGKKKDFHIHEILFLVNTADCISASHLVTVFVGKWMFDTTFECHYSSFIHFNLMTRSDVLGKLNIPSLSPFPALLCILTCRSGLGAVQHIIWCCRWSIAWTTHQGV